MELESKVLATTDASGWWREQLRIKRKAYATVAEFMQSTGVEAPATGNVSPARKKKNTFYESPATCIASLMMSSLAGELQDLTCAI